MREIRSEEKRYCATCGRKTVHWVTEAETAAVKVKKAECRACGTVDQITE